MILNDFKGKVFAGDSQVSQIYHGTVPLWADEVLDLSQDTQIAFLFDTTGSMSRYLSNVKSLATAVARKAEELESNVQYALSGFKDQNSEGFAPLRDFTDIDTLIGAMPTYFTGGGDLPENGFGAIVNAESAFSWDPEFSHSIFLFTDATSNTKGATQQMALNSLNAINASFHYGTAQSAGYGDLATATNGFYFSNYADFESKIEAQQQAAE